MVVFTCGHCGESVQKPKVEKHYLTKCRNRNPNLSCMDCFKDFLGDAYEAHTKCITEEERYSGKGFMAKEKKGERKQNTWVEMLQSVLDEQKGAPKNVLRIIETVSKHNNTPRKRPKFFNFVKNVCGSKTSPKDIDQAWELISVKLTALSAANAQNQNQNQQKNGTVNGKLDETTEENDSEEKEEKLNGSTEEAKDENEEEDTANNENGENLEEDSNKKLSKKQRKEEKKRKKYEAELQSVAEPLPEEEEIEDQTSKKGKKKKTKSECSNGDIDETQNEGKNKNKKRKRQDTVNVPPESLENDTEDTENVPVVTRVTKKKQRVQDNEELDESVCLHDQNVAKIEELTMNSDKFNWHAVIMSVLQKKDNEMPFKRLQKKVLMEYSEATGREVDDRIADKFIKKLKSAPNVRVDKNRVMLLE